ncbi:MFS transporter [Rhizobium oryzicola]|uniref:MFS transporter n=1 Tax=Rhizobium oryzicola TaxID=1232668 RepID=A0ABT8SZC6_9HYPH|nr:MFS transporter [Rhizobium oryzicola]MDO1583549.1 MFS transporter [Rhizobium oryzicola]
MTIAFLSALKDPGLRVSATAMLFFGFAGAATGPYQSIIGIQELGLSDTSYAALMFAAAVVNVVASVMMGIVADRMGDYRSSIIYVSLFGVSGYALVYLAANVPAFVISKLLLLPIFGALNSLIFANVRAASGDMNPAQLVAVNSTMRATISLSWVAVPGLVGVALAGAPSMLPAYLWAALSALICFILAVWFLPRPQAATGAETDARYKMLASLKEVAEPRVLLRVIAIALIFSMLHVNDAVRPLIISLKAGGSVSDIGLVIGIVAFLEIIFILFWGMSERWLGSIAALATGAVLYVAYMVLQGLVSETWQAYALTPLSGFAAAAIISLPITYLQNLIADRPGLGSSLIAVNVFLSAGLSSLVFAIGTRIGEYGFTSILGGSVGFAGIVLLILLDGKRARTTR